MMIVVDTGIVMRILISMTKSYYKAEVYGTGNLFLAYKAVVTCQHPNGQTLHYEKLFPFFTLAKFVAIRLAKSKEHSFTAYWSKEFKHA